jgi:hypothetical protein
MKIAAMNVRAIVYLLIASGMPACSGNNDCFVAETTTPVKTISIGGVHHFLFLRSSGFNEKEHFYELYKKSPMFDECGKTDIAPISEVHLDTSEGMLVKLVIDERKLKIIYSKKVSQDTDLSNIPIEVK